jgi:hypothetical protein
MSEFNPYAAPSARLAQVSEHEGQVWREGGEVVLTRGSDLPPRCVKCNGSVHEPVKQRTLSWHTPWLLLLILVGLLIYIIVAAIASKRVVLSPALCDEHRAARRNVLIGAWLGFLIGFGLIFAAVDQSSGALGLLAALLMIGSLVFGMVKGRIVHATRIDQYRIRLKGCGPAFLDSLPRR